MVGLPELRTDPLSGDRVVVAPRRAIRPGAWGELERPDASDTAVGCPFCEGQELETPPEVRAIADVGRAANEPGWCARLVPNKFPAFADKHAVETEELFPSEAAVGVQDVLIHTPAHRLSLTDLERARLDDVAALWRWRGSDGRPPTTAYTHIVVNEGSAAGASLAHSHSQLFSLPFLPPRVLTELDRQARAPECLMCRTVTAELARNSRIVAHRDGLIAYCPHASRFVYETVIAPLDCEASAFASERLGDALALAVDVLSAVRATVGWAPANLWLSSSPHSGTQTHWRITVAPRLATDAGLELGAGILVNPLDPEAAAAELQAQLL